MPSSTEGHELAQGVMGNVIHPAPIVGCHTKTHATPTPEQGAGNMAQRQIPDAWRVLMDRKAISSARQLGMKAGVSHVTANRLIFGDPFYATEETIQKIADALGVDYSTIYGLAGRSVGHAEPWTPPASAARLTMAQREVLDQLINTMVNGAQVVHHPEQDDVELAADTSHGPAESQRNGD